MLVYTTLTMLHDYSDCHHRHHITIVRRKKGEN